MDVGVVVSDVLWIVCGVDDVHWMCVLFCVCLSTLLLLNADPQDAVLVTFFFFVRNVQFQKKVSPKS